MCNYFLTDDYRNQVDDVDLYIAGLSETPVEGGLLGATFSCILSHQFRDIKNGDRLWHENGGNFTVFDPGKNKKLKYQWRKKRILPEGKAF